MSGEGERPQRGLPSKALCRDSSLSQHYGPTYCLYSYRQDREMHTLVQLDVEYYNLGYNHL